jgi:hypothetical protein
LFLLTSGKNRNSILILKKECKIEQDGTHMKKGDTDAPDKKGF